MTPRSDQRRFHVLFDDSWPLRAMGHLIPMIRNNGMDVPLPGTHRPAAQGDYSEEHPFRATSDDEWLAIRDFTADGRAEEPTFLATMMFSALNECRNSPVHPRKAYHLLTASFCVAHASAVFKPWTLTAQYGPFAQTVLESAGVTTLQLSGAEWLRLQYIWLDLKQQDVVEAVRVSAVLMTEHDYTSADGWAQLMKLRYRPQATLLVVPAEVCMQDDLFDAVVDFRPQMLAHQNGRTAPIQLVKPGSERNLGFHRVGVETLQQLRPCSDEDTVNAMASTNFDTWMETPPAFVYTENNASFYAAACLFQDDLEDELSNGMLEGPFLGPAFAPQRNPPAGGVLKQKPDGSFSLRRTGDGGGPHFSWDFEPLAVNEHVNLDNRDRFPALCCPTPAQVCMNLAIIASLAATTGIAKLRCCLLLTDWEKYYRSMVVRAIWLWTSCLCVFSGGLLVDLVKWFGDRGAPATCCAVMDVLLFFWTTIVLLLLERVTRYCVVTQTVCERGSVRLALATHGSPTVRAMAASVIAEVAIDDESLDWDIDLSTQRWRQGRYDVAHRAGMTQQEAVLQSLPLSLSGYYDDGQSGISYCLRSILVAALFVLVHMTGIKLSVAKMFLAVDDQIGKVIVLTAPPTHPTHFMFSFSTGSAVVLGVEVTMHTLRMRHSLQRLLSWWKAAAHYRRQRGSRGMIKLSTTQSILGISQHHVNLRKWTGGLLNSLRACTRVSPLIVHNQLSIQQHANTDADLRLRADLSSRQSDPFIVVPDKAVDELDRLICLLSDTREEGVAFYPARDLLLAERPRVYIFLDSAGPAMRRVGPTSVIDKDDRSVRGAFAYMIVYNADGSMTPTTFWSFDPWPQETFLWAFCSTTLEAINANMTLQAVLTSPDKFGITPQHVFVEVLDNKQSARQLRYLTCKASENFDTMAARTSTLSLLGHDQQVYTAWLNRKLGSLADHGSKAEFRHFMHGLRLRGLPPPAELPFTRQLPPTQ